MDQQKKPTQSEDMDREGGQGQQSKQKEEQRLPGQIRRGSASPAIKTSGSSRGKRAKRRSARM